MCPWVLLPVRRRSASSRLARLPSLCRVGPRKVIAEGRTEHQDVDNHEVCQRPHAQARRLTDKSTARALDGSARRRRPREANSARARVARRDSSVHAMTIGPPSRHTTEVSPIGTLGRAVGQELLATSSTTYRTRQSTAKGTLQWTNSRDRPHWWWVRAEGW